MLAPTCKTKFNHLYTHIQLGLRKIIVQSHVDWCRYSTVKSQHETASIYFARLLFCQAMFRFTRTSNYTESSNVRLSRSRPSPETSYYANAFNFASTSIPPSLYKGPASLINCINLFIVVRRSSVSKGLKSNFGNVQY